MLEPLVGLTLKRIHVLGNSWEFVSATVGIMAGGLKFNQCLDKLHKVTIINLAQQQLALQQLLYATNDAYVPLKVFVALDRPGEMLLITNYQ